MDHETTSEPLLGKVIAGRYKITRQLAEGGMGEVWLARQLRLDRDVVVKTMPQHHDVQGAVERFEREAKNLSGLQHPHIVAIHDYGVEDDGLIYIVMEYIDGETLYHYLKRHGRMRRDEFVETATQMTKALAAAHKLDIVHRDLKPANVMFARSDDQDIFVKLIDFGLSKQVAGQDVTQTKLVLGSVSYMAPEVITEQTAPTQRADVYSLGVLFYEMLSGRLPFESQDPIDQLKSHMHDEPPKLDSLLPPAHGIPSEIIELIESCMSKDPARRPANAREVRELLDAATQQPKIVIAQPESGGEATIQLDAADVLEDMSVDTPPRTVQLDREDIVEAIEEAPELPKFKLPKKLDLKIPKPGPLESGSGPKLDLAAKLAQLSPAKPLRTPEHALPSPQPEPTPPTAPSPRPAPATETHQRNATMLGVGAIEVPTTTSPEPPAALIDQDEPTDPFVKALPNPPSDLFDIATASEPEPTPAPELPTVHPTLPPLDEPSHEPVLGLSAPVSDAWDSGSLETSLGDEASDVYTLGQGFTPEVDNFAPPTKPARRSNQTPIMIGAAISAVLIIGVVAFAMSGGPEHEPVELGDDAVAEHSDPTAPSSAPPTPKEDVPSTSPEPTEDAPTTDEPATAPADEPTTKPEAASPNKSKPKSARTATPTARPKKATQPAAKKSTASKTTKAAKATKKGTAPRDADKSYKRSAKLAALLDQTSDLEGTTAPKDDAPKEEPPEEPPAEIGMLDVKTIPAGVTFRIDGKKRGKTPAQVELPTGPHKVEYIKDGKVIGEQKVNVTFGLMTSIKVDLQEHFAAKPETPPPAPADTPAATE